jgi:NADPH2:quinone reductase
MRAVAVCSFGGPEVLSVIGLPVPEPGAGQVRLRVRAAPVHPVDLGIRSGMVASRLPERPHYVLGWDAAGTVDAVGPGVCDLAVGDAVVGYSDWWATLAGTQAEFVVLEATALARAPSGIAPVAAASLPANALTAWQALDLLDLSPGQHLAIMGAGGAVGGYALELAVHRGLQVIGVGAAHDEAFVTGRGARFLARSNDPAGALRALAPEGVDAVLDTARAGTTVLAAVGDGGVFVTPNPPAAPVPARDIRVATLRARSDGAQLRALVGLVEQAHLTLRVAQTFPLEQAAQAHARLAEGGVRGRLVLTP